MSFIPITKPWITESDIDAVVKVLQTGMLVQGENVAALEQAISNYLGGMHTIAISNGTATMHIMLTALGIGPGDEVIVPAFSYVATANVVELAGAKPVFVDINIRTFNIDSNKIEEKITPKTKAILLVHEFGLSAPVAEIQSICNKHNLLLLEDAACALGAEYQGKRTGTFGFAASFSLHPRKAITSGEGGLITTQNKEFADKCRVLRNHGVNPDKGITGFSAAGFNYRMTDFQAALVLSQFDRFEQILIEKNKIAKRYLEEIKNPAIVLPAVPDNHYHSWQSFHIMLLNKDRADVINNLKNKGIGANYGAQCIPAVDYYREKYGFNATTEFPNAYNAFVNGLVVPLYPQMTEQEINYIIQSLNEI